MKFPWLPESEIERQALRLLTRVFGRSLDRSRPVDLEEVVAYLSETEQLSFNDDAVLPNEDDQVVLGKTQVLRRRILLSRDLKLDPDSGRSRFTLAHELGHWVLHRPLFVAKANELSLFDESAYDNFEFVGLTRTIFREHGTGQVAPEEWQANRFAVALLIDAAAVRNEFQIRFGTDVVARSTHDWRLRSSTLRQHSRVLATALVNDNPPLRDVFGISVEAMAIALETRGYSVEDPPLL